MIERLRLLKLLFINHMLVKGKKQLSEKFIGQFVKRTQKFFSKNHVDLIRFFMIKTAPIVAMKLVKRKKKQVKEFPYLIKSQIRNSKAIKTVIKTAQKKSQKKFIDNFTHEFAFTLKNKDKNKQLVHEYAFTTKKFAHFRWFF